ncbi:hypothetical protein [Rhodococcus sp. NPDC057529]|uniref:hypothetical protein n=1 Tax=Rhodococcus sp. NPDC057529 TaxID=3346158 RepID=UPI00366C4114
MTASSSPSRDDPMTTDMHERRGWVVWTSLAVVVGSSILILCALVSPWLPRVDAAGGGCPAWTAVAAKFDGGTSAERSQSGREGGEQCESPEAMSGDRSGGAPSTRTRTFAALIGVHLLLAGAAVLIAELYVRPRLPRVFTLE